MRARGNDKRKWEAWCVRNGHRVIAADTDKRLGIPECARRMMAHRPYGGMRYERLDSKG